MLPKKKALFRITYVISKQPGSVRCTDGGYLISVTSVMLHDREGANLIKKFHSRLLLNKAFECILPVM